MIPTGISKLDAALGGGATPGVYALATSNTDLARMTYMNIALGAIMAGESVLYLANKEHVETIKMQFRLLCANVTQCLLHQSAVEWSTEACRRLSLVNPTTIPVNRLLVKPLPDSASAVGTEATKWQVTGELSNRVTRLVIVESIDGLGTVATSKMTQTDIKSAVLSQLGTYAAERKITVWTATETEVTDGNHVIPFGLTCDGATNALIGATMAGTEPEYMKVVLTSLITDASAGSEIELWLSPTGRLHATREIANWYDRINGAI
jgi:predicted ATP-dependent serine protease